MGEGAALQGWGVDGEPDLSVSGIASCSAWTPQGNHVCQPGAQVVEAGPAVGLSCGWVQISVKV